MMKNQRLRRIVAQVVVADPLPPVGTDEYRSLIAGDTTSAWDKPKPREKTIATGVRNEGARWTLPKIDKNDVRNRLETILNRYEEERDKRKAGSQQRGGVAQYPRIAELAKTDARFAKMIADPHIAMDKSEERIGKPLLFDRVEVCLLGGGGFGGLAAGARMVERGIEPENIRLVDRGGDVGGTWYWNRYPGAMCDTEAPVYMPLLEEVGYTPTERYAHQPEIYAHSKAIATTFGLYKNALFGAECSELRWDESDSHWIVSTTRGDKFKARFIVNNIGTFTHPKLPAMPGVPDFKGHMFHTSRWDYDYTGGNQLGNLFKLKDKVVGIIGSGPTAVQAIPHLADYCKHLYSFQRTPSPVDVRNNHFITPDTPFYKKWMTTPGWQRDRIDAFTRLTDGSAREQTQTKDVIEDGWTSQVNNVIEKLSNTKDGASQTFKRVLGEVEHMERIRDRVTDLVKNEDARKALTPWYSLMCKRPCFHDEYLQTFNKPNVTLVDVSKGGGADAFTPNGIVAYGKEYEMDCIIIATGFEVAFGVSQLTGDGAGSVERTKTMASANGYEIIGRNGQFLSDYWANGCRTIYSYNVHNFPNMWLLNGPQGVLTSAFVVSIEKAGVHAAHMIQTCREKGWTYCEVTKEAEDKYCQDILQDSTPVGNGEAAARQKFYQNCTPGYYNSEGNTVIGQSLNSPFKGGIRGSVTGFLDMMEKMRNDNRAFDEYTTR